MEEMKQFFIKRLDGYDEHMLTTVEGCKEAYEMFPRLLPDNTDTLLDLGCGTGLELKHIFRRFPDLKVTGVDLTKEMLEELDRKYQDKDITLVNQSYFDYEFREEQFDVVISCETMHHFEYSDKVSLYTKIHNCLKQQGMYIECDYMITSKEEEEQHYKENRRLRKELGIKEGEFYHYDTPCTIKTQKELLVDAGFTKIEQVFRKENTTILIAYK
ncbi:MAG: class I SAM-dependent methyltransferase [bacterium]|nr:class I SAM-dependent methyltransferase [bacterium]